MNPTLKNSIIGTTAAAVLATGIYIASNSEQENEFVDDITAVQIDIPKVNVPKVNPVKVDKPEVNAHVPKIRAVNVPKTNIFNFSNRIPQVQELFAQCELLFQDQRNIANDRTICLDKPGFQEWLKLYKQKFEYRMQYVELADKINMVAEIHHPINFDILNKNLEFYRKKRFNAVLITFGYEGENIHLLVQAIELAKSKGFKVWFAYSGPEKLGHSIFESPEKLKHYLQAFSLYCDGFIIGWRRTSVHLFEQDSIFRDYLVYCVRMVNPAIPIVGEAYYGQTASSNLNVNNLVYNIPSNASGVLITGLGYNKVAVNLVLNKLLKDIKDMAKMVLIVGDRPYYGSRRNNNKNFIENFKIKQRIADRWKKNGVSRFVFLHGDGSDGIFSKTQTDNLGEMEVIMK